MTFSGSLNGDECQSAYDSGFSDFVPVSDYFDTHHDSCFRAYNLHRELISHGQDLEGLVLGNGKKLDPEAWVKIGLDLPDEGQ